MGGDHRIVLMLTKLCLLLGCAALACGAQPQKVFPYDYSQEDLPNGLRLVTVPTDYANIVATYIVVQTGSRNEVEPGHTGFAHLFEHLMFRGTEKYPPEKYNQTLNRIGASSNASTSDDLTVYHTTFSKEDLETVLAMEADRFQHLKYAEPEFKTESLAVLGEYNKNSASPFSKLNEVLQDTAFDPHTYKHTTMGFLKDIQDMPNQYEYSLKFFDRYYRPEYTTIIVVGDVKAKAVRALVDKYWGEWKRGSYKPEIPVEPPQNGAAHRARGLAEPDAADHHGGASRRRPITMRPRTRRRWTRCRSWHSPTLRDLYQKLVVQEQKVDALFGECAGQRGSGAVRDHGAGEEGGGPGLCARPDSGDGEGVPGEAGGCRAAGHGAQAPALSGGAEHGQQRHDRADSFLLRGAEAHAGDHEHALRSVREADAGGCAEGGGEVSWWRRTERLSR